MELLSGRDVIAFMRAKKNETKEDATKIRFATDVSVSWEKETDSVATMDGNVNTVSDGETTLEFTSIAYTDDEGRLGMWAELHDYYLANERIGSWLVMLTKDDGKDLDAWYFEGRITSFDMDASADGQVELTMTVSVDGNGVRGTDSLTEAQMDAVNAIDYEYKTLSKIEGV